MFLAAQSCDPSLRCYLNGNYEDQTCALVREPNLGSFFCGKSLNTKFDGPVARQDFSHLATAHVCETGLFNFFEGFAEETRKVREIDEGARKMLLKC